jgi:hypothetical protein
MSVPMSTSGVPRRITRLTDPIATVIRPKRGGNGDRAVGVLMMLEQAGNRARERESGAIEVWTNFGFSPLAGRVRMLARRAW